MTLHTGEVINEPIKILGNIYWDGDSFPDSHELDYDEYSFQFNNTTISCTTREESEKVRKDIELSNGGTNKDYVCAPFVPTKVKESLKPDILERILESRKPSIWKRILAAIRNTTNNV